MMDALLYAVRDQIRQGGLGYDIATCELTDPDGMPPPRCGKFFAGVHQNKTDTGAETDNKLDEYFSFGVTVTQRIVAPLDRVGDKEIAVPQVTMSGFNRRVEALRAVLFGTNAWTVIAKANNYLLAWAAPEVEEVYGFCEAYRYRGCDGPHLVADAWFRASPPREGSPAREFGLVSTLNFNDARRFQPVELAQVSEYF